MLIPQLTKLSIMTWDHRTPSSYSNFPDYLKNIFLQLIDGNQDPNKDSLTLGCYTSEVS